MNDNNSTIKTIFWCIVVMIIGIIILGYYPDIKRNINNLQENTVAVENNASYTETDKGIFSDYEIKNNDIVINSYLDGIVFDSSANYTVQVLKDDMGYILTSVEKSGIPPKEYYFIGKGWFNMTAIPLAAKEEIIDIEETSNISE